VALDIAIVWCAWADQDEIGPDVAHLLSRKKAIFFSAAFKTARGPRPLACDATTLYWTR